MAIENRRRVLERLFPIAVFLFSALWLICATISPCLGGPTSFPGKATSLPSPNSRFRLINRDAQNLEDSERMGGNHTLSLLDTKTGKNVPVLRYSRNIAAEWSPDSAHFYVTEVLGSDESDCFLYDSLNLGTKPISLRDAAKNLNTPEWRDFQKCHHSYVEGIGWRDAKTLRFRCDGYGKNVDVDFHCLYIIGKGLVLPESVPSRIPASHRLLDQEIGFLEDREVEINTESLHGVFRYVNQVRCAFRATDSGWAACPDQPNVDKRQWTAVRAGKKIGVVLSEIPKSPSRYPADVGLHVVVEMKGDLESTSRSLEFSGFPGDEVRAPIVLVRKPCLGDKDGWTRTKGTAPLEEDLFRCFKKSVNHVFVSDEPKMRLRYPDSKTCVLADKTESGTSITYIIPNYRDSDLEIRYRFRASDGRELLGVAFRENTDLFEDLLDGGYGWDYLYIEWFYRDKSGLFRFLLPVERDSGFLTGGMVLIDFGDYDNDGKTEAVFWFDGYDINGYVIYWNDFRKHDTFLWSYH